MSRTIGVQESRIRSRSVAEILRGSNGELMILDFALGGDDERIPVALRPVTQDVLAESEAESAVVALVDGASDLY